MCNAVEPAARAAGTDLVKLLRKYQFDPGQSDAPEWWLRGFHGRHVPYFNGAKKVLDLGAGRGLFLEELRRAGIEGVGVDHSPQAVSEGMKRGLKVIEADIFDFFESAEGQEQASLCDGVYCAHVVEHLEPPEVFELFGAIRRYCAPGARVRVITNNPEDIGVLGSVFWGDLTHKRLYPAKLLEAIAVNRGFTSVRSEAFLGLKLGIRESIRRLWDKPFWGQHKWLPNILVDCRNP